MITKRGLGWRAYGIVFGHGEVTLKSTSNHGIEGSLFVSFAIQQSSHSFILFDEQQGRLMHGFWFVINLAYLTTWRECGCYVL